jgi:hypothetical protein
MQIELAKTVASRPATAFAIVANVVDWPEIISSIKSIEVLTPGPIRAGRRLQCDARVGNRNDRTSPSTTPSGRSSRPALRTRSRDRRSVRRRLPDDADLSKQTYDAGRTGFAAPHVTVHGNYIA